MIPVFRGYLSAVSTLEKIMVVLTFLAMLVALIADVIGREFFSQGVFGSVKFAVYALILCAMAGFGLATASGSHLRPKFLDFVSKGRVEMPVRRMGRIVSAGILLFLGWGALQMVAFSHLIEERDLTLGWLVWPVQMILPVAFAISALRHLIYAVVPSLMPVEEELKE